MVVIIKEYNLLISCPRNHERDAVAEVIYYLAEIGDENAEVAPLNIPSLLAGKTNLEPISTVRKLRDLFKKDLIYVQFTQKFIPLEIMVKSSIENIKKAVDNLKYKIKDNEKFRITIEKRYTNLNKDKLIKEVADLISNKVDLNNPDKIILIEIISDKTGISIIRPDDILSIPILRRNAGMDITNNEFF
ncbi:MAG: THUMP domain-containing protein [Candidatus Helarchaeota archaeon]